MLSIAEIIDHHVGMIERPRDGHFPLGEGVTATHDKYITLIQELRAAETFRYRGEPSDRHVDAAVVELPDHVQPAHRHGVNIYTGCRLRKSRNQPRNNEGAGVITGRDGECALGMLWSEVLGAECRVDAAQCLMNRQC